MSYVGWSERTNCASASRERSKWRATSRFPNNLMTSPLSVPAGSCTDLSTTRVPEPSACSSMNASVERANWGAGLPSSRSSMCRQASRLGGSYLVTSCSISDRFLPHRPCCLCRRPSPWPSRCSIDSAKLNHRASSTGSSTSCQTRSGRASTRRCLMTSIIRISLLQQPDCMIVHIVNSSSSEQFEEAYTRIWAVLHKADDPDLSQHERNLMHHIPPRGGVPLTWLVQHLALPERSASVLVKDLERRGFVSRSPDRRDER